MASLIPVLQLLWINDSASIVLITVVVYDYMLTITREINFIWSRPWTWVSTIFVIVRYFGLCWALTIGLAGSTFVPGPLKTCKRALPFSGVCLSNGYCKGTAIFLLSDCVFSVFIAAAELVMILRVYAIWGRSKKVLAFLMFIFMAEVATDLVVLGIYDDPKTYFSVTVVQLQNVAFCDYSVNTTIRFKVFYRIPRYALAAGLLFLALIQTLSQSIAMYRATGQWQHNRYMKQFMTDGILYFFLNTLFNIFGEITNAVSLNSVSMVYLSALTDLLLCPIVPRFVISTREMYERDLRSGSQGIDTGFGMVSRASVRQSAGLRSAIVFADGPAVGSMTLDAEGDEPGMIQLEAIGDAAPQA